MRNMLVAIVAYLGAVAISAAAVRLSGLWLLAPVILLAASAMAGALLFRFWRSIRGRHVITGSAVAASVVSLGLYVIDWAAATTAERLSVSEFIRYLAHPPHVGDAAFIMVPILVMCSGAFLALLFRRPAVMS